MRHNLGRYRIPLGLIVADFLHIEQKSLRKRIYISLPLFAAGLFIIFALPFQTIWSYFAWCNQTLAAITLWAIVAYLAKQRKPQIIALIPALFMSYVCTSYMFVSPLMFGLDNRALAYVLGGVVTIIITIAVALRIRKNYGKAE